MYAPDLCLYHADCTDGFGAAWAIWKRWPQCAFMPAAYGAPLDLDPIDGLAGLNILFVDFSAPADTLRALVDEGKARSVVVLDHHKSAQAALAGLPVINLGEESDIQGVVVLFDMEKSGARLAWEFAHPNSDIPQLIQRIEDRDLWRFRYPDTKEVIAAVNSYPQDFQIWDTINRSFDALVDEGEPILRAQAATVEMLLKQAYDGDIAGHTIPMVNAPKLFSSDIGHRLLEIAPQAPFAATWFRRADGLIEFSLRSQDHRQDVSEVATLFGGGGHRNAAGFQLEMISHGHSVGAV
jgi:oligoribonuclease NrnB/cAMP/cGMP phosphodiesterase (DHH superfamily)